MKFSHLFIFVFLMSLLAGCSVEPEKAAEKPANPYLRVPESNIKVPDASAQCLKGRAACKAFGLEVRREFPPEFHEIEWMYDLVFAAQSGDYAKLQSYIHPDHGFFLIHKPGVAPTFQHFSKASELAGTVWGNYAVQTKKAPKKLAKEDVFMTGQYRLSPEWVENAKHDIPPLTSRTDGNFIYWNNTVKALEDSGMLNVKGDVRKKMDEVSAMVHMELFYGQFFYFGEIEGKWYLFALDVARSDFSA